MPPETQFTVNKKEYKIWMEEGVIVGQYGENIIVTEEIMQDSFNNRLKNYGHLNTPMLIDTTQMKYVTRSALNFANNPEGQVGITALGILVNNFIFKTIVAFFFNYILKTDHPTMVFTDKKEAIEWLKKFREEDISIEPNNEHN